MKRVMGVACAAALMVSLTACGGSDRPSAAEVSKVIQAEGTSDEIPKEVADCIGRLFVQSDLSDDTLKKAVETDGKYFEDRAIPAKDKAVLESSAFTSGFGKCIETLDYSADPDGEDPQTEKPKKSGKPDPKDQPVE